jgi:CheY-like chemotaxis protein
MDDMMPKMSGTQTLNKLREIASFNMPVFALTANAITGMKERYLEAGFDSYLAKPIEKEAMILEFNKLFNKPIEKNIVEEVLEEENKEDTKIEYLLENSIDVNHGLELLGNLEAYDKRMSEFVEETNRKMSLLSLYKENEDMLNYAILIHGIKSDCKYLGIIELNEMAYEHELKSKANEIEFVNKSYDDLINLINKYLAVCKNYLGRE